MKIDNVETSQTLFQADAIREAYVDVSINNRKPCKCGKVKESMYGSRGAAQNRGLALNQFMTGSGLERGQSSPFASWRPGKELMCVVPGGDLTGGDFAELG